MAELAERLLLILSKCDKLDTLDLPAQLNTEHEKVVGAVKSLQSRGDVSSLDVTTASCTPKTAGQNRHDNRLLM